MFAIVKIAGQQFKVQKDQEVFVYHLGGEAGDKVAFEDLLLISDDNKISSGKDIEGKKITAEIVDHVKGDKVIAFKMKRRKGFRKKKGFRQQYTKIRISDIA